MHIVSLNQQPQIFIRHVLEGIMSLPKLVPPFTVASCVLLAVDRGLPKGPWAHLPRYDSMKKWADYARLAACCGPMYDTIFILIGDKRHLEYQAVLALIIGASSYGIHRSFESGIASNEVKKDRSTFYLFHGLFCLILATSAILMLEKSMY